MKMSLEEATMKALLGELEDKEPKDDVEGIVDGIMVVTDPEITPDEYEEVIDKAQEILEDTPEGEVPFNDQYVGEYLLTCPICGSSFINKDVLNVGDSCPICTEVPEQGFILNGQVATQEDVELQNNIKSEEEDEEDSEEVFEEPLNTEEEPISEEDVEETKEEIVASEEQKVADNKLEENKEMKNESIEDRFDYTEIYDGPIFIRSEQIKDEYGTDTEVNTFCLSLADGDTNFEPETFSDTWESENLEKAKKAFDDNEVFILQEAISPDELGTVLAVYYGVEDFEELFVNTYTDVSKVKIVKMFEARRNPLGVEDDKETTIRDYGRERKYPDEIYHLIECIRKAASDLYFDNTNNTEVDQAYMAPWIISNEIYGLTLAEFKRDYPEIYAHTDFYGEFEDIKNLSTEQQEQINLGDLDYDDIELDWSETYEILSNFVQTYIDKAKLPYKVECGSTEDEGFIVTDINYTGLDSKIANQFNELKDDLMQDLDKGITAQGARFINSEQEKRIKNNQDSLLRKGNNAYHSLNDFVNELNQKKDQKANLDKELRRTKNYAKAKNIKQEIDKLQDNIDFLQSFVDKEKTSLRGGIKNKKESLENEWQELTEAKEQEYTLNQADEAKIKELENGSAFTWEGIRISDEDLKAITEYFKKNTPLIKLPIIFYTWKGKLFNEMYNLTGTNAYPEDLNFLSISLDQWTKMGNLPMIKIAVGARWLDDIVDNNRRRQKNIKNESFKRKISRILESKKFIEK